MVRRVNDAVLVLAGVGWVMGGCSGGALIDGSATGGAASGQCTPGETRVCAAPTCSGAQLCLSNATWSDCYCPTPTTGGSGPGTGGFPPGTGGVRTGGSPPTPTGGTSATPGLTMDTTGWVDAASNPYGIQGAWYAYSDAQSGGRTVLTFPATISGVPYVAGRGMCLLGSTPGGGEDNYQTWGAGIGLNLNQTAGSDATPPLPNGPQCYLVTVTAASTLGGIRAKLVADPTLTGHEAPGMDLMIGQNMVCIDTVYPPSWCGTSTTICDTAATLANGVAAIQVQLNAGASGGTINLCVTSIVPSDG